MFPRQFTTWSGNEKKGMLRHLLMHAQSSDDLLSQTPFANDVRDVTMARRASGASGASVLLISPEKVSIVPES